MRQQNIKNLTTEKDGIKLLRRQVDKFIVPSIEERKRKLSGVLPIYFIYQVLILYFYDNISWK